MSKHSKRFVLRIYLCSKWPNDNYGFYFELCKNGGDHKCLNLVFE